MAKPHASEQPIPPFELAAQYQALRAELQQAVRNVLESTVYIGGAELQSFEEQLGQYVQANAVAVSSGTDALLAVFMALGIGAGDAVITTPFTFFATAGCISRVGAKPVFADIHPDTFLLDLRAAEAVVTRQTRALVPVHLFGQMQNTTAAAEFAARHNAVVIEDAAQCIGAKDSDGLGVAQRSRAACLSFYPTKNLGAAGDAGAVVTRDADLAARLKQTRQHGETQRYVHATVGGNFRMDAIQAAVLKVKLKYVDQWNKQRRAIASQYTACFAHTDVRPPAVAPGAQHVFHQYVIRAPRRDALREYLSTRGIGTNVFYPRPLHLQSCFADLGYAAGAFPHAEKAAEEVLALPMFPELGEEQVARVARTVLEFYR